MRFLAPLVALLMLLWSHTAVAAPLWRLSEVAGPVRLQKGNLVRPAARGATLTPGESVVTGPGGRAIMVRGEEMVVVFPGARIRVPEQAEQSGGIIQMIQDFGEAIYKIQRKATPHFGVKTPYMAAVVKGTTFKVSSDAQGAAVRVMEGRVEVATADGRERRMVVPGRVAKVAKDRPDQMVEEVDTDDGDEKSTERGDETGKKDKSEKGEGSAAAENRNERSLSNPSTENRSDNADQNRSVDKSNNGGPSGFDKTMGGPDGMGRGFGGASSNAAANLKRTADVAQKAKEKNLVPDNTPKPPKPPKPPKAMAPVPGTGWGGMTGAASPPPPPPLPTGLRGPVPPIS